MKPSPEQLAIINAPESRICVIAAPGSGKTKTLVWRIIADIQLGVPPERCHAVTFTNAGAVELKKRLADEGIKIGFIGTLHAYMMWLAGGNLTILDAQTAKGIALQTIESAGQKNKMPYSRFSDAKEAFIRGEYVSTKEGIVIKQYRKTLAMMEATDFDLILHEGFLFVSRPENHGKICDALYVDEFQDSAQIDAMIYDAIAPKLRFVVGDPDQSIFAFRGARMRNLIEFSKTSGLYVLNQNYRSGAKICTLANNLIRHNKERIPKECTSANLIHCATRFETFARDGVECSVITNDIMQLLANSSDAYASEIAILCRYNETVGKYREALKAVGVPIVEEEPDTMPGDMEAVLAALSAHQRPEAIPIAARWAMQLEGRGADELADIMASMKKYQMEGKPLLLPCFKMEITSAETLAQFFAEAGLDSAATRAACAAWRSLELASVENLMIALREGYAPREAKQGVTVTTYHGAKGREFERVYAPCCDADAIPGRKTGEELEEERRLFFVMITRAKSEVYISHATKRKPFYGRGEITVEPSPFIAEAFCA